MNSRFLKISIAIVAMALLLWGCGGGGDDTTASSDGGSATSESVSSEGSDGESGSVTKAAFIKEADKLCEDAEKRITGEIRASNAKYGINPKKGLTTAQQEAVVEDLVLPGLKVQAEELDELTPPEGDEDEIAAIVAGIEKAATEAEKVPNKLLEASKKFQAVAKMSVDYGMKSCGQP